MFCWEPEGRYHHRLCTEIAPLWFSMEHLWTAITPFWLSTDDIAWYSTAAIPFREWIALDLVHFLPWWISMVTTRWPYLSPPSSFYLWGRLWCDGGVLLSGRRGWGAVYSGLPGRNSKSTHLISTTEIVNCGAELNHLIYFSIEYFCRLLIQIPIKAIACSLKYVECDVAF